jgi:hypothetical protein
MEQGTIRCDARCGFCLALQIVWGFMEIYSYYSIDIDLSIKGNLDKIEFLVVLHPYALEITVCLVTEIRLIIKYYF